MKRISECLAFKNVLAPQSVAASKDVTSAYVDASGTTEVAFLISTGALGAGKSLKVSLMAAEATTGAGAAEVKAAQFTDAVGKDPQVAVISYKVRPENGRFLAVKIQHDAAAEVICGVAAVSDGLYLPEANGWTLAI